MAIVVTLLQKSKRSAFYPIGGGRHLCPSRNFAFAEISGFLAALIIGFDICPLKGEDAPWKLLAMAHAAFSEATPKLETRGQ